MPDIVDPVSVSNPQAGLQQILLQRAQSGQQQLDKQRSDYEAQMGKFEGMLKQPPSEAGMWGAMAAGAAKSSPMVGGFGALLANIGAAYGQQQAQEQQQQLVQQQALTKLKEDYLKTLEGQQTKLLNSTASGAGSGKFVPMPGVPGYVYNNVNPTQVVDMRDAATRQRVLDFVKDFRKDYATEEEAVQAAFAAVSNANSITPEALPKGKSLPARVVLEPAGSPDTIVPGETPQPISASGASKEQWVATLNRQLKEAVSGEDYGRALKIKEALSALAPISQPSLPMTAPARKDIPTERGRIASAEADAQAFSKDYNKTRDDLENLGNLRQPAMRMYDLASSDKTFNGPLAEVMTSAGGLVSYFDPNDSLSKKASDSQAYYASLQELVRNKLKAYGSGTAVSNLDLISAEKSVASLINTNEGKKLILQAIIDDMNRAEANMQSKINFYEDKGTLHGWRPPNEPSKATVNGKTVTIQDYYKAFRKRNPDASFGEIRDAWQRAIAAQQQ